MIPADENFIIKIRDFCKKIKKFYLSNNIKLAIKLNLDGAYIPSFNKNFLHLNYSFRKNFELIGQRITSNKLEQRKFKEQKKL